jgi:hypothetical protein
VRVKLTATAEQQLDALPENEYQRVAEALHLLESFPIVGKPYAQDSPFAEKEARYFVVRVARHRAVRITYRPLGDVMVVLYLFPATYPLTHPDHLRLFKGKRQR